MINYWLAKQEPNGPRGYNFLTLQKEKTTVWDGVHNNLALKHMRNMKKDDQIIYYHTGDERQAVGIMSVITNPYPNPEEDNDRFVAVNVKFKKKFQKPVSLEQMKKEKSFKNWELLRIGRLSIMPVPKSIWDKIIKMSQAK
jgi:predicted RNA-binding protein with PUA-like domain